MTDVKQEETKPKTKTVKKEHFVAVDALSTKKGIKVKGEKINAEHINGGQKHLDNLVKKGLVEAK